MTEALGRLRSLAEQGRIAAEFPAVAPLLAALDRAELARAGRLLARLDPDDVLRCHPGTQTVTAVVTGSGTLGGVIPPLAAELARNGLLLRHRLSDFDRWIPELQDTSGPLYTGTVDLVLCVLDAETVFRTVPTPWRLEDAERAAAEALSLIGRLAECYSAHGTGTLVLNTVPLLRPYTHQLVDHASRHGLGIVWREFNIGLLRLAARHERVSVIDLDPLVAEGGPVHDVRLAAYAKARLGDELLGRYAREVAHLAKAGHGRSRKVLVVDLDNTLWDGVLAEDGPDGIAAAGTLRGEAFGRFQRVVGQLGSQGVLLAVSSKNDRGPVLEALRDHPDLTLHEGDFVHLVADWRPKADQLQEIAEQLGLGLDGFVVVDDSPAECALVAAALPAVAVVGLNHEPAEHIERLLADGWFDIPVLTADDRSRAARYQAEAARRAVLDRTGPDTGHPAAEHLRELRTAVELSPVRPHEVARIAQLTLRTNQFNLTGERLQVADVQDRLADADCRVLAVRSRDRFGDQGIVGAVFARRTTTGLRLDNVLLSCRVLSRGIEQAALAVLMAEAANTGLTAVEAGYRPTARNHRTRDFYPSLGFRPLDGSSDVLSFRHDLRDLPAIPGHISLTAAFSLWADRPGCGADNGGRMRVATEFRDVVHSSPSSSS